MAIPRGKSLALEECRMVAATKGNDPKAEAGESSAFSASLSSALFSSGTTLSLRLRCVAK